MHTSQFPVSRAPRFLPYQIARKYSARVATSLAFLIAAVALSLMPQFSELRSRLLGKDIWVSAKTVYLPGIVPGQRSVAEFSLKNLTKSPLKLLGASTSCRCTVAEDLPFELGPMESHKLLVSVTPNASSAGKEVNYVVEVYFDGTTRGERIKLTVKADVASVSST